MDEDEDELEFEDADLVNRSALLLLLLHPS